MNELRRAIDAAYERLAEKPDAAAFVAYGVLRAAAVYWEENPGDFGVQHASDGVVIFGGSNRVRWTASHGFELLAQHSPPFAEHFARVGAPLPRRVVE